MPVDEHGFQIFLGDKREPGEAMKHVEREIDDTIPHMANFLKAVKSRNRADLNADVSVGVNSADLVHMANISYRRGPQTELRCGGGQLHGRCRGQCHDVRGRCIAARTWWHKRPPPALYWPSNPNAATPLGVPTYTLPLAMVGTMNLFPAPKWSRPLAA